MKVKDAIRQNKSSSLLGAPLVNKIRLRDSITRNNIDISTVPPLKNLKESERILVAKNSENSAMLVRKPYGNVEAERREEKGEGKRREKRSNICSRLSFSVIIASQKPLGDKNARVH